MMRGLVALLLLSLGIASLHGEDCAHYLEVERKALDSAANTELLRTILADSGARRLAKFATLENTRTAAEEAIKAMQMFGDKPSAREAIAEWQAVLAADEDLQVLRRRWVALLQNLVDREAEYRRQAVAARALWLAGEIASFRRKIATPGPMSEIP